MPNLKSTVIAASVVYLASSAAAAAQGRGAGGGRGRGGGRGGGGGSKICFHIISDHPFASNNDAE